MINALLLAAVIVALPASNSMNTKPTQTGDEALKKLIRSYVVEFLRRNPTVNTYLGGAGLDSSLKAVDGKLRDHSPPGLRDEDRWLGSAMRSIERVDPRSLSPNSRIDREVALAQIRFLLHQHQVRRYQQRAIDTYTDEPFRAIDWQLQGMTQTGEKSYGTGEEWSLVVERLKAISPFLEVAEQQIKAGVQSGNTPDYRVLQRNGLETAEADAKYFEATLPRLAEERLSGPGREALLGRIREASQEAAGAYRKFRAFIATTFFLDSIVRVADRIKPQFRNDRYAMGQAEYDWALKNNFRINKTAAQLYRESWPIVQATRNEMIELARKIGKSHGWSLPAGGAAAVRTVFDELSKDYPKSDVEMVQWYTDAAFRLVEYARKTGIFDVPRDYKLEVTETPPPLRASIDGAAYYPAPPFKNSGVGRFYLTTTGNDIAALKANNRASVADLSAHEGFPGHDWHYKVITQYRERISPIRWLTPGAVEDSSSMWEDSIAIEGWALYSEALMTEPQPGAPDGFYTPEERLYQLQGKLYRDLRVRIDTGIHTGRMSYNRAVDLFSEVVDFLPGSCSDAEALKNDAKRASCHSAERAIFRYSKWPTQAITYRLGKDLIFELRKEAARLMGDKFSAKNFHVLFMKQGTIPAGYFRGEFLRQIREEK